MKEKNGTDYNREEEIRVTVYEGTKSARCAEYRYDEHASRLTLVATASDE